MTEPTTRQDSDAPRLTLTAVTGILKNFSLVHDTPLGKEYKLRAEVSGEHHEAYGQLFAAAPELATAVDTAEDLLAFHEGSAEQENEKSEPVVWINNEDLERVLAVLREAQAKARGQS